MQYRTAGAAAREMLIAAAAKDWGVDVASLDIVDGMVTGTDKSAPLGAFVDAASGMDAPAEPKLKDPSAWKLIGNPNVKRVDSAIKGNGQAVYAMDIHLPNQMVVMIARPPQRGGVVDGVDDSGATSV